MSKSYDNNIPIFLPEKQMRKKVMSIVTDSTPVEAPKNPENSTILALYRLVASPEEAREMEEQFRAGGVGYGEFKKRLFSRLWEYFAQMRQRREELLEQPERVDEALREGAAKAQALASQKMEQVRRAAGLRSAS